MKKMINTSMAYFIFAILAGVFYREFTKFNGYTGETMLAYMHTHLFVLGMFLFFILALFCKNEKALSESKGFRRFYVMYNIALPFVAGMMLVRGIVQVKGIALTRAADASISGIAGIAHIFITAAMILLFTALKKNIKEQEK